MPRLPAPSALLRLTVRSLGALVLASLLACTRTEVVEHPIDDALLEAKVLDIVRQHPQVMLDAISAYQVSQQEAAERQRDEAQRAAIAKLDLAHIADGSPVRGDPAGRLVLVEFSDFECPFCARAQATLATFLARHGAEVTTVFKHLPLPSLHPHAMSAARAAWAAQQQGRFWEYHDLLFARQASLGPDEYLRIARELRLDPARFERDRSSEAAGVAVGRDLALARELGLTGTPFFLINREPVNGAQPLAVFEAALERARSAGQASP